MRSSIEAAGSRPSPVERSALVEPTTPHLRVLVDEYETWVRSWLDERRPWYTTGATRWLERNVGSHDVVFEYGAGRSTPWWCELSTHVTTLEASPRWIAYLNFYLSERPELLARSTMIHVPSDWNPSAPDGFKQYWKEHAPSLRLGMIDELERRYLSIEPARDTTVLAFDGSIRALTMARWALDGSFGRPDVVVVDNTENGATSALAGLVVPDHERLDFVAGDDDIVPAHQGGKHVTTVFVSPDRARTADRSGALDDDAPLAAHQSRPDPSPDEMSEILAGYRRRLGELGIVVGT